MPPSPSGLRDLASGSVLALLAVVYFIYAHQLPWGQDEPGPAFFPQLLAVVLFALSLAILVQGSRNRERLDARPRRSSAAFGLTVLYALGLTTIGFLVSTFGYVSSLAFLFGQRGVRVLVIALVTTASIYAMFALGLGVPLP